MYCLKRAAQVHPVLRLASAILYEARSQFILTNYI